MLPKQYVSEEERLGAIDELSKITSKVKLKSQEHDNTEQQYLHDNFKETTNNLRNDAKYTDHKQWNPAIDTSLDSVEINAVTDVPSQDAGIQKVNTESFSIDKDLFSVDEVESLSKLLASSDR